MLLTFKTNIKLNRDSVDLLHNMSNEARLLYNKFLNDKLEYYKNEKKYLSYYTQQKELKNYKTDFITYDCKKETLRRLEHNFKSYFQLVKHNKNLNPKPPKYRSYKYFFTLTFVQDFIIKNNQIIISLPDRKRLYINLDYMTSIQGLVCKRNKTIESEIKQLTINYDDIEDKYYANISYEKKENEIIDTNNVISIDLGKKNLVTLYDSETNSSTIYNSSLLNKNSKYYDKRIDELKSKRDNKKVGSRKHKKLRKKIRKLGRKKKQQNSLILHKLSKDLVKKNKTIVLGELTNLKQNTKTNISSINRQMFNNWNLTTFINLLEYKSKLNGNKLIKVNEAWTTKTCSRCGTIHDLTLNDRKLDCECGLEIDRDVNASINIFNIYSGNYNIPHDTMYVSERFSWCDVKKMNKIYEELYSL